MKIAIWYNFPSGGAKRALYYQIKYLVKKGHNIEVWCPQTADRNYMPISEFAKEHVIDLKIKSLKPWLRILKPFFFYYNIVSSIKEFDLHCRKCAQQINSENFEILFSTSSPSIAINQIAKYVKIPSVIYLQEPNRGLYEARPNLIWTGIPKKTKADNLFIYLKDYIFNLFEVRAFRTMARSEKENAQNFNLILVNSLFSREGILRSFGLDSKVNYLGIDTNLFRPEKPKKEFFVVGIGSIHFIKGIDRAIKAIATIPKDKRPKLVWIANYCLPSYKKEMEKMAIEFDVDLTFKIMISDEELVNILNKASVMIYTLRLEPFGLAPLEANACGLPVVAIAEGGIRETVVDGVNGFLIKGDDPAALGSKVLKLLENPSLAKEIGENARKYVIDNWSWVKSVDELENFLKITKKKI